MQEGEVDVALEMLREPWLERGGFGGFAFAVEGGEDYIGAAEDGYVG